MNLGSARPDGRADPRTHRSRESGIGWFFVVLVENFMTQVSGLLTEMDSRFRGNDVISARRVAFRLAVIPAKAGIHRLIQAF